MKGYRNAPEMEMFSPPQPRFPPPSPVPLSSALRIAEQTWREGVGQMEGHPVQQ